MRGADSHPTNRFVEVIVYPRKAVGRIQGGPHVFDYRGVAVGEGRQPVVRQFREPPTVEILRINHYHSTRSETRRVCSSCPRSRTP